MYQQNKSFNLDYLKNPEEEFNKLLEVCNIPLNIIDNNKKEYDLEKEYRVNWACIWNKPANVGKSCRIVQKNSKVAFVVFEDDSKVSSDKIYRLEDLD